MRKFLALVLLGALMTGPVFSPAEVERRIPKNKGFSPTKSQIGVQPRQTSLHQVHEVPRGTHGKIKRSASVRNDFMRQSGYPHDRRGYVVDYIKFWGQATQFPNSALDHPYGLGPGIRELSSLSPEFSEFWFAGL